MLRLGRVVVVLVIAFAGLCLLTGSPANAAGAFYCHGSCLEHDARGDSPARADLLSARVTNGRGHFYTTIKVRDLGRTGSFVFGAGVQGWIQNYWVKKTRRGITVQVQPISEVDVYPKSRCARAKVTWNAATNVIHASFAYECTGSNPDDGGSIIDGIDFHSGGATDHMGKVFYRP